MLTIFDFFKYLTDRFLTDDIFKPKENYSLCSSTWNHPYYIDLFAEEYFNQVYEYSPAFKEVVKKSIRSGFVSTKVEYEFYYKKMFRYLSRCTDENIDDINYELAKTMHEHISQILDLLPLVLKDRCIRSDLDYAQVFPPIVEVLSIQIKTPKENEKGTKLPEIDFIKSLYIIEDFLGKKEYALCDEYEDVEYEDYGVSDEDISGRIKYEELGNEKETDNPVIMNGREDEKVEEFIEDVEYEELGNEKEKIKNMVIRIDDKGKLVYTEEEWNLDDIDHKDFYVNMESEEESIVNNTSTIKSTDQPTGIQKDDLDEYEDYDFDVYVDEYGNVVLSKDGTPFQTINYTTTESPKYYLSYEDAKFLFDDEYEKPVQKQKDLYGLESPREESKDGVHKELDANHENEQLNEVKKGSIGLNEEFGRKIPIGFLPLRKKRSIQKDDTIQLNASVNSTNNASRSIQMDDTIQKNISDFNSENRSLESAVYAGGDSKYKNPLYTILNGPKRTERVGDSVYVAKDYAVKSKSITRSLKFYSRQLNSIDNMQRQEQTAQHYFDHNNPPLPQTGYTGPVVGEKAQMSTIWYAIVMFFYLLLIFCFLRNAVRAIKAFFNIRD